VPDSAPPYDGEQPATPAKDHAATAGSAGGATPSVASDRGLGEADRPPASPSAAGGWPSQFAQVLAETLAGSRPAQQLTPWTTEQTRRRIRQLGPLLSTGQRPLVRRVITSEPAQDVLEMTAVVGFGPRVRVLALRLERAEHPRPHWRCTAIESA